MSLFAVSEETLVVQRSQQGPGFKKRKAGSFQEQRRKDFLERQKDLRGGRVDLSRNLLDSDEDDSPRAENDTLAEETGEIEEMQVDSGQAKPSEVKKKIDSWHKYRDQLSIAEYFVEMPSDFASGAVATESSRWLLASRPLGTRCLVASANGCTVSRGMDGVLIERFHSLLPGGSLATTLGSGGRVTRGGRREGSKKMITLLDCIYCPGSCTYYVLDVINWKDYPLQDCTAEFRFYWLSVKFAEDCDASIRLPSVENPRAVVPVLFSPVTPSSVHSAYYNSDLEYLKDGLIFYHKDGHYESGLSPLVLLWPDIEAVFTGIAVPPCSPDDLLPATLEYREWVAQNAEVSEYNRSDMLRFGISDVKNYGLFTLEGYLAHQFADKPCYEIGGDIVSDGDLVSCAFYDVLKVGSTSGSCFSHLVLRSRMHTVRSHFSRSAVDSWSRLLYLDSLKHGASLSISDLIRGASADSLSPVFDKENSAMAVEDTP